MSRKLLGIVLAAVGLWLAARSAAAAPIDIVVSLDDPTPGGLHS
jgi:hypothetical protein